MDRLACVDVPAFPLQLLLSARPQWRDRPSAVVERDAPQGVILWANELARRAGILPGATYAAALALEQELVAGVIDEATIARGVDEFVALLGDFSPKIEPCNAEPGVFWIDASGLALLHPTLEAWSSAVHAAIRSRGFVAALTVGFRRFASYATAKSFGGRKLKVFADADEEARAALSVPLSRIGLPVHARDELAQLGIHRVAEFVRLPSGGVLERFGEEAHRLHRMASGELLENFAPLAHELPIRERLDFEEALVDATHVLWVFAELAAKLLVELAALDRAVSSFRVRLELDDASPKEIEIACADATLELAQLERLLRLRLERLSLARGVTRLEVELRGARASREQLQLFRERPRRDLSAARRALDLVRAAFGDDSVVRAVLADKHLPEASFAWEKLERLEFPNPSRATKPTPTPTLVRRIFARSIALPPRSRHAEDGWLLVGVTHGPVKKLVGPYALSGAWWRDEIRRDYYFAELSSGARLWVYFDRARRRWFWQGNVS